MYKEQYVEWTLMLGCKGLREITLGLQDSILAPFWGSLFWSMTEKEKQN